MTKRNIAMLTEQKDAFGSMDLNLEIKAITSKRLIEGYASTFNNIDSYGDTIRPGAFAKTIKKKFKRNKIKFLSQHQWDRAIGLPTLLIEDSVGLKAISKVVKTQLGDEALELADSGVVDGLSIGYKTIKASYVDEDGVVLDPWSMDWSDFIKATRVLEEIDLSEYSQVTFPADESALITQVKTRLFEAYGNLNDQITKKYDHGEMIHIDRLIKAEENIQRLEEMILALKSAGPAPVKKTESKSNSLELDILYNSLKKTVTK